MSGIYLSLFAILILAALSDSIYGKIPNILIITSAISYCLITGPIFLLRAAVCILVLFIFYHLRIFGAGDIKLAAIIVGSTGITNGCIYLFISLILSAIYSLYILISKKIYFERYIALANHIMLMLDTRRVIPYPAIEKNRDQKQVYCIPMAVFMLGGTFLGYVSML